LHPILFKLGPLEIGTYGLIIVLGFFAALWLAKRQGKLDGLAPEAITDLSILLLLAGLVGSKALMVVVDLIKGVPVSEVFSVATLRAGGAIHGGVIGGVLAFFWRMRKGDMAFGTTIDALPPAVALGQAIGRLGCLAAGCCYGSECHAPFAITFTNPEAFHFSGTPLGIPLHPVQLYTMLGNLAVMGLLLFWRPRRRFAGQIAALYFMLEGVARMVMETWRGDVDRGLGWLGMSWLSTGRVTALGFVVFGIVLWAWMSRRPQPTDPQPAASQEP